MKHFPLFAQAHYETTGTEIRSDFAGKIDALVAGIEIGGSAPVKEISQGEKS